MLIYYQHLPQICLAGLAQRAAANPKQFFGHIRTNKRLKKQVVTLKDVDGIRVTDPSSQANIFAEVIHWTFRPDERVDDPAYFKDSQPMPLIMFTPDIVARHLMSLNPYKTAGPDGLHPKGLRTLAPFIAECDGC